MGEDANREERRRRRGMKWKEREQQIFSRGRGWRRKRAPCTGFLSMHYSCALFIADVDSVVVPSNPLILYKLNMEKKKAGRSLTAGASILAAPPSTA